MKTDNVERSIKKLSVLETSSDSHEGTSLLAAAKYSLNLKQGLAGSQTKKDTLSSGWAGTDDDAGGTTAFAGEDLKGFRVAQLVAQRLIHIKLEILDHARV